MADDDDGSSTNLYDDGFRTPASEALLALALSAFRWRRSNHGWDLRKERSTLVLAAELDLKGALHLRKNCLKANKTFSSKLFINYRDNVIFNISIFASNRRNEFLDFYLSKKQKRR